MLLHNSSRRSLSTIMTVFIADGYQIILQKEEMEDYEGFMVRGNFVAKQKPKTKREIAEAIFYSRIYINVKMFGMVYQDDIMEKLNKMTI